MKTKQFETELGIFSAQVRSGKPLIVFLNGAGNIESCDNYYPIIKQLEKKYGIFAVDYLDNGKSSIAKKNYSIDEEAKAISDFIEQQDADSIVIVAHSIGGIYAKYLAKYVTNITGMVLIEPTTKEIIINPPQSVDYIKAQSKEVTLDSIKSELKLHFDENHVLKILSCLTKPPYDHGNKFNQIQQKNFIQLMQNDMGRLDSKKVVIFTQSYRIKEYQRSEFFAPDTKLVSIGQSHYLHWHYPNQIIQEIKRLD